MSYKKFLLSLLAVCLILAGIYSSFMYVKDPLGYYHVKKDSRYYNTNGRYQLPAFIKNFDYDTIFIGPSMSQNFIEKNIDRELHVKSYNAALSAASAREQRYIYELADSSHKNLKNVYWELNFDSLYGDTNRVNEESGAFPAYLYNTFPLDDIKYLFSYYAGEAYLETRKAEKENRPIMNPYDMFKFGFEVPPVDPKDYKKSKPVKNKKPIPDGVSFQDMKENFDQNILPAIKEHPNQIFNLYYTPYPITYHLFHFNRSEQAFIDRLKMKEYIFKQVGHLDHVNIFDFQTESTVTFTISNYMDGSHYFAEINNWMIKQFAQKSYVQTPDSIQKNNKKLLEQVENFSSKQLVQENKEEANM